MGELADAEHDPSDYDDPVCHRCNGEGFIITCGDDLCQGAVECMHGDEVVCPDCDGEGCL